MGYFSELAYDCFDNSYPPPERQLLWRLQDLKDRLAALEETHAPFTDTIKLTDCDIRYAIPTHFETIFDVERAILMAINDLRLTYAIDVFTEMNRTSLQSNEPIIKHLHVGYGA